LTDYPPAGWWFLLPVAAGFCGALYILIGYPLLLWLALSRRAPAVRKDLSHQPSVSIIVAVYNGESHIAAKLDTLTALAYPSDRVEIIIVSDGSTDGTARVAREYAARDPRRRIVVIEGPRAGKAGSLNLGIARATGEILFFTDVRQPLDPAALAHLAANFADPSVGAVTGEMRLRRGDAGEQQDMDLYWRYEIWARGRQSEIDSLFNTTGCIYAMRRSLAGPIPPDTLTDDAVLPLRAFFAGYRVIFDPVAIAWDAPAVAGTEFRRRFRTLAGLCQVFARVPQLFSSRNRMRWHFLSHKFGRLALPWTVLLSFSATWMLPASTVRTALLVLEFTPVCLALLNSVVPRSFPLKRLTSPARTFLVMNLAALAAPAVFVLPPEKIWKPTVTK
jgi:cellulose synthase/poly-beta-1,6-N-acetylglucosamine synthase-like glycosyltransferase